MVVERRLGGEGTGHEEGGSVVEEERCWSGEIMERRGMVEEVMKRRMGGHGMEMEKNNNNSKKKKIEERGNIHGRVRE